MYNLVLSYSQLLNVIKCVGKFHERAFFLFDGNNLGIKML